MKERTLTYIPPKTSKITYNSRIFSLGSCFSAHISDRLAALKYSLAQNPCGITFNPYSLFTAIKRTISPESLLPAELNFQHGLWSHPDFHGSFNHMDQTHYLDQATKSLISAEKQLKSCNYVILTIGTSFVFRSLKTRKVVNNCHKLPADNFSKELLQVSEVTELLEKSRDLIMSHSSDKEEVQFIFSVSPVRHIKNGLVEDRKSKATAQLAIHNLVDLYDNCHYFPAYEVMVDELRDYRYYDDDLIHPRKMAVDYIFDLFQQTWLDDSESDLRKQISAINNRQTHRPLFPDSPQHLAFVEKLQEDIGQLVAKHPQLSGKFES